MAKIISVCISLSLLFVPGVYAQKIYKAEPITGIGATLYKLADGSIQIIGLISKSPAEYSGLSNGDFIVGVKSLPSSVAVDVSDLALADVVGLIRGPAGIPVEITFVRGNDQPAILSIVREVIEFDDRK